MAKVIDIDRTNAVWKITVVGAGAPFTFDPSKVSDAVRQEAFLYGLEIKLSRAAALPADKDTGKSAPASDKRAAVEKVVTRLEAGGPWNATERATRVRVEKVGLDYERLLPLAYAKVFPKATKPLEEIIAARMRLWSLPRAKTLELLAGVETIARAIGEILATESGVNADEAFSDLEEENGE